MWKKGESSTRQISTPNSFFQLEYFRVEDFNQASANGRTRCLKDEKVGFATIDL